MEIGLTVAALVMVVTLRVVLSFPRTRKFAEDVWSSLVRRATSWTEEPPLDPWARAMQLSGRRHRLLRDLRRISALVDDDSYSATRHFGHRLAYGWARGQLEDTDAALEQTGMAGLVAGVGPAPAVCRTGPILAGRPTHRSNRSVEVLDSSRRRGSPLRRQSPGVDGPRIIEGDLTAVCAPAAAHPTRRTR